MARSVIEGAESRGDLKPGQTVVEYTGGSTGTSLAMVCAVKGYPLRIVTADVFAQEKLRTMRGRPGTCRPVQGWRGAGGPPLCGHPADRRRHTTGRFRFHNLVRLYAIDRARAQDEDEKAAAGVVRLIS
jgi:hypothetical protein